MLVLSAASTTTLAKAVIAYKMAIITSREQGAVQRCSTFLLPVIGRTLYNVHAVRSAKVAVSSARVRYKNKRVEHDFGSRVILVSYHSSARFSQQISFWATEGVPVIMFKVMFSPF